MNKPEIISTCIIGLMQIRRTYQISIEPKKESIIQYSNP